MNTIRCFWCQCEISDQRDVRYLTDNTHEWRTLCKECPVIPVQITLLDPNFYCTNFCNAVKGLDYNERLLLSPDMTHPGLWIQAIDGTMYHSICIKPVLSHDLEIVCYNQEKKTLVFCIPEEFRDEWMEFRLTWLV